jgi:hypothetical protein
MQLETQKMDSWLKLWNAVKTGTAGANGELGRLDILCLYGQWQAPIMIMMKPDGFGGFNPSVSMHVCMYACRQLI